MGEGQYIIRVLIKEVLCGLYGIPEKESSITSKDPYSDGDNGKVDMVVHAHTTDLLQTIVENPPYHRSNYSKKGGRKPFSDRG